MLGYIAMYGQQSMNNVGFIMHIRCQDECSTLCILHIPWGDLGCGTVVGQDCDILADMGVDSVIYVDELH